MGAGEAAEGGRGGRAVLGPPVHPASPRVKAVSVGGSLGSLENPLEEEQG